MGNSNATSVRENVEIKQFCQERLDEFTEGIANAEVSTAEFARLVFEGLQPHRVMNNNTDPELFETLVNAVLTAVSQLNPQSITIAAAMRYVHEVSFIGAAPLVHLNPVLTFATVMDAEPIFAFVCRDSDGVMRLTFRCAIQASGAIKFVECDTDWLRPSPESQKSQNIQRIGKKQEQEKQHHAKTYY